MEGPKRSRGRPRKPTPSGKGRIRYIESEIRKLTSLRDAVIQQITEPKEGTASPAYLHQYVTGYARVLLDLRNALDLAREAEEKRRAESNPATDPRDRTMEQVTAEERAHAMELDPVHLQIYVAEWLGRDPQRTTLRLVTLDGTPVEILRRTA